MGFIVEVNFWMLSDRNLVQTSFDAFLKVNNININVVDYRLSFNGSSI